MKDPDAPFYFSVNNVSDEIQIFEFWKSAGSNATRFGTNKLEGLMKEMSKKARLQNDNLRNHSARKTMIETLSENNVPPAQIAQLPDHKKPKKYWKPQSP